MRLLTLIAVIVVLKLHRSHIDSVFIDLFVSSVMVYEADDRLCSKECGMEMQKFADVR